MADACIQLMPSGLPSAASHSFTCQPATFDVLQALDGETEQTHWLIKGCVSHFRDNFSVLGANPLLI